MDDQFGVVIPAHLYDVLARRLGHDMTGLIRLQEWPTVRPVRVGLPVNHGCGFRPVLVP